MDGQTTGLQVPMTLSVGSVTGISPKIVLLTRGDRYTKGCKRYESVSSSSVQSGKMRIAGQKEEQRYFRSGFLSRFTLQQDRHGTVEA